MRYDFTSIRPTRAADSRAYAKLDAMGFFDEAAVPLGVAEMMFPTAPAILQALHDIVENAYFGYMQNEAPFRAAVCRWMEERRGLKGLKEEQIVATHGVVAALGFSIRAFSKPGEGVMIQPPVYGPFARLVRENGRRLVENRLLLRDGRYEMDFADMEEKFQREKPALFLLCSPHNPVGRVWTRAELERVHALAAQYGVQVVADEIHQDILPFGIPFTPYASVEPGALCMSAASKTFDIAGLSQGYAYCMDEVRLSRFRTQAARDAGDCFNPFGMAATAAAYTHCAGWMEEMLAVTADNIRFIKAFVDEKLPGVSMSMPEGTYLCWLDMGALGLSEAEKGALLRRAGLDITDGLFFGTGGEGHIRINAACPRRCLEAAMERLSVSHKWQ